MATPTTGQLPVPSPLPGPTPAPISQPPTASAPPVESAALVPVITGGYSIIDPQFKRLYGPGVFAQDELGNTIVGTTRGNERIVSNRFRAPLSGKVTGIKAYWQTGRGYALGKGGDIRIRILPDDGSSAHLPVLSGAPLASGSYRPGLLGSSRAIFDPSSLQPASPLVAGHLYHVVFENVHSSPASNYISTNNALTVSGNGRPARWLSPVDWATLHGHRLEGSAESHTWRDLTLDGSGNEYYVPILQLNLADGQVFGNVDMEGGAFDPNLIFVATESAPVRERFSPSGDMRISGVSFATAASVAGTLKWEIKQGSIVLSSGSVAEGSANYRTEASTNDEAIGVFQWYDLPLSTPIDFVAGSIYDLVFTPQGASQWKFADERNGKGHGFRWPASFSESQAQHFYGGRWINANHWYHALSTSNGANWRVMLHLAP